MNLLDSMMEPFIMMDRTTVSDGGGGFDYFWVEGAPFQAYVRKVNANEVIVAEQQNVQEVFTVVVPKGTQLEYHDAFKRVSDNAVFRMTSTNMDANAPDASTVAISKGTCERWQLT